MVAARAKVKAESEAPSSTFSPSLASTAFGSSFTPDVVDSDVEGDVCAVTPFFGTLGALGYCPSPTCIPADITTTATTAGRDEKQIHVATAGTDGSGDTNISASTSSVSEDDRNSSTRNVEQERQHDGNAVDGSNNRGAEPNQTASTNEPPTPPTDGNANLSVWTPKRVLAVGDKLTAEPLLASTGTSAVWATKRGDIVFVKEAAKSSDASGQETSGGLRSSVLVAADIGKLKRVVRARQALLREVQEGDLPAQESRRRRSAWGWVPFRSRHENDVERAREHLGEVEMTLSDRGCVVSCGFGASGVCICGDRQE